MTCTPSELMSLAKCFVCLDQTQTDAIEIYLLCVWENATTVGESYLTDENENYILTDQGDRIVVNL